MITNQYGVWQPVKEQHDGTSSPVQNGWHRNGTPASVSLLRGPNRGERSEVVADQASISMPPCYAKGYSHPQRGAQVVSTPSSSRSPLLPQDCQSAIPQHFAVHQSAAALVRDQRRRDLLASIEEFWRASGSDRTWWRRDARHRLAEWRTLYRAPERAAFQAAVKRSQGARP